MLHNFCNNAEPLFVGELTIFDIKWFSIYDRTNKRDLGHIIIPGQRSWQRKCSEVERILNIYSLVFVRRPQRTPCFGGYYKGGDFLAELYDVALKPGHCMVMFVVCLAFILIYHNVHFVKHFFGTKQRPLNL